MSLATDKIREVANDILAEWLDGVYFTPPTHDEYDWHLKLDDDNGPGQVFVVKQTGHRYRIEMRVTKLER